MNSEEEINKKIWDILQEIKIEAYYKGSDFEMSIFQPKKYDELLAAAIMKLEKLKIIQTDWHIIKTLPIIDKYTIRLISRKKFDMLYLELKYELFPKIQIIEREIVKEVAKQDHVVINQKANYKNGVLYFQNQEINFNNKQNQKDLLVTLFKNQKKNWFYDEIQEEWDEDWDGIQNDDKEKFKNYWKKFYSAGDGINTAVAIKTGIEDFIIKNTKEIKIN